VYYKQLFKTDGNTLCQGWAIFSCRGPHWLFTSLSRAAEKLNVLDRKRNYFFNSKSTARIHLKTDNKQIWTYLLQQRGPQKKLWRAGCGPLAVEWAALLYALHLVTAG
jgi:hypothetical protein